MQKPMKGNFIWLLSYHRSIPGISWGLHPWYWHTRVWDIRGYPTCSFPKLLGRLCGKICLFTECVTDSSDVTLRKVMVFLPQQHVHLGTSDLKVKKCFFDKFSQCITDNGTSRTQVTFCLHGREMLKTLLQLIPSIFKFITKCTLFNCLNGQFLKSLKCSMALSLFLKLGFFCH